MIDMDATDRPGVKGCPIKPAPTPRTHASTRAVGLPPATQNRISGTNPALEALLHAPRPPPRTASYI
ncbi:hypothetical protein CENSYa_1792 [Cenarchaeum symbiosum A]|uniref:Uncharacterized protein n=1 Tax=Cenarchaeum symbiosum (strain A) TaxID=414004 RepID=A0RYI5_CENSY|nr:hypothetical protein CENSYa_1792 [Cenarchaeum symbiosum A]